MNSKKQKRAIALAYDQKKNTAPIVKAKGKGFVAQKIIEKAKEKDIPIYEDPSLAKMLDVLNIDEKFQRSCLWR